MYAKVTLHRCEKCGLITVSTSCSRPTHGAARPLSEEEQERYVLNGPTVFPEPSAWASVSDEPWVQITANL